MDDYEIPGIDLNLHKLTMKKINKYCKDNRTAIVPQPMALVLAKKSCEEILASIQKQQRAFSGE